MENSTTIVEAATTDLLTTKDDVMNRYQINSVNTLKRWCEVLGIQYGKTFDPEAIAKFDHLAHHVREQGMSIAEYQALISDATTPTANETHGRYYSQQDQESGNVAIQAIVRQYSETVDQLADTIADSILNTLNVAVLVKLEEKVKGKNQAVFSDILTTALEPSREYLLLPSSDNTPVC